MRSVHTACAVARLWAAQSQYHARTAPGNFFFNDSTIFSYGAHFPIAKHVVNNGRAAILFTTRSYSATTARHICVVRRSIARDKAVFHVRDIDKVDPQAQLLTYAEQIEQAAERARRARVYASIRRRHVEDLVAEANAFAAFFGLLLRVVMPPLEKKRSGPAPKPIEPYLRLRKRREQTVEL